jgi:predicted amidophosphoribosyltransferase
LLIGRDDRRMSLANALVDLLLPPVCVGCGAAKRYWCVVCARQLAEPTFKAIPGVPALVAAGPYEGSVRTLVHAWKEGGAGVLTAALVPPLTHAVLRLLSTTSSGPITLVPVPPTKAALRRRGVDPLRTLARDTTTQLTSLGFDVRLLDAVAPARARRDQSELSASARAKNMQGSLQLVRRPNAPVVIIDDIVTTGATLREAVRALGTEATVLGCAVVAATPKHSMPKHHLTTPPCST